jgi:hypothetical protein
MRTQQQTLRLSFGFLFGLVVMFLFLTVLLSSCQVIPGERTEEQDEAEELTATDNISSSGVLSDEVSAEMIQPTETALSEPALTFQEQAFRQVEGIQLIEQKFIQTDPDSSRVLYGFVVYNSKENEQARDMSYQLTLYDSANTELTNKTVFIPVHMPEQFLGKTGEMSVGAGVQVARMEIVPSPGSFEPVESADSLPRMQMNNVGFQDESFSTAVGIVQNVSAQDMTDVQLYALAYDINYEIVGGGETMIERLPANGTVDVTIPLQTNGKPAGGVTVYPTLSESSVIGPDAARRDSADNAAGSADEGDMRLSESISDTLPLSATQTTLPVSDTQVASVDGGTNEQTDVTATSTNSAATPTSTPTPGSSAGATSTPTVGSNSGATSTPTAGKSTTTATATSGTASSTGNATNTPASKPTSTPTNTNTPKPGDTPAPTKTPTNTPTDKPTNTPTDEPTETPIPTETPTPQDETPTPENNGEATNTPTQETTEDTPTPTTAAEVNPPSGDCAANAPASAPAGPEAWLPVTELASGDEAKVCVWMVLDGAPVQGANVSGVYNYMGGRDPVEDTLGNATTDANGVAMLTFPVPDTEAEIEVSIEVEHDGKVYNMEDAQYADKLSVIFIP